MTMRLIFGFTSGKRVSRSPILVSAPMPTSVTWPGCLLDRVLEEERRLPALKEGDRKPCAHSYCRPIFAMPARPA